MIHGILFDFDGTLVDSNECKIDCFYEVVADTPEAAPLLRTILADPGVGDRTEVFGALGRQLFPVGIADRWAADLVAAYTSLTEERVGLAPKRNGAMVALDALQATHVPMGISSATPQDTLMTILARQRLTPYFSDIFGAPQSKPEHIKVFARQLSCPPDRLIYVGDSEIDRAAAARMGCKFIAVGEDARRFAGDPGDVISDLSGLPARVRYLSGGA